MSKSKTRPELLFTRSIPSKQGVIIRPISFYIGLNKLDNTALSTQIKKHGGKIATHPGEEGSLIYSLVDPLSKARPDGPHAYSVLYISRCIEEGRLLDLAPFRLLSQREPKVKSEKKRPVQKRKRNVTDQQPAHSNIIPTPSKNARFIFRNHSQLKHNTAVQVKATSGQPSHPVECKGAPRVAERTNDAEVDHARGSEQNGVDDDVGEKENSIAPVENDHNIVSTENDDSIVPADNEDRVVPAEGQHPVAAGDEHSFDPAIVEESATPAEYEESIVPVENEDAVSPIKDQNIVLPTDEQHSIVAVETDDDVIIGQHEEHLAYEGNKDCTDNSDVDRAFESDAAPKVKKGSLKGAQHSLGRDISCEEPKVEEKSALEIDCVSPDHAPVQPSTMEVVYSQLYGEKETHRNSEMSVPTSTGKGKKWTGEEDQIICELVEEARIIYMSRNMSFSNMFEVSNWDNMSEQNLLPPNRSALDCLERCKYLFQSGDLHKQEEEASKRPRGDREKNTRRSRPPTKENAESDVDDEDESERIINITGRRKQYGSRGKRARLMERHEESGSEADEEDSSRDRLYNIVKYLANQGKASERRAFRALRAEGGNFERALRVVRRESRGKD